MNSLEFIEKEIDVTKKLLSKFPLSKKQSDPNYKYKEVDIQYIHNRFYTERIQALQQLKTVLEAWEVVKDEIKVRKDPTCYYPTYLICLRCPNVLINKEQYETIKKALEVNE